MGGSGILAYNTKETECFFLSHKINANFDSRKHDPVKISNHTQSCLPYPSGVGVSVIGRVVTCTRAAKAIAKCVEYCITLRGNRPFGIVHFKKNSPVPVICVFQFIINSTSNTY